MKKRGKKKAQADGPAPVEAPERALEISKKVKRTLLSLNREWGDFTGRVGRRFDEAINSTAAVGAAAGHREKP